MAATTKKKPAKQTADAAKKTVATAKRTGTAAKNTATSAAKTAGEATKDTATAAKDTATSAAKSAGEATKDTATAAKDTATSAVKTAGEATKDTATAARKTASSAAKTATSATKRTATAVKNTAASAAKAAQTPPSTDRGTDDHGEQAVKDAIAATRVAMPSSFLDNAAAKATEALKSLPTIDFSNFDLDTLKQLDPRKIEWSKLDISNIEMPDLDRDKLFGAVRDAAYVMVGFGVLAFQQAQVRRREMADAIGDRFGSNRKQMEELIATYEARLTKLDEAIEARVDHAVGLLGERLPDQAETLLYQVNSVAKSARKQMRGLLSTAA
jgi:hypothetical protein